MFFVDAGASDDVSVVVVVGGVLVMAVEGEMVTRLALQEEAVA